MTRELKRITYKEFAGNLARFFRQVVDKHEPVVVENDSGEGVVVQPLPDSGAEVVLTEEDYRAFRSAFGGWADVDTEPKPFSTYP